MSIEAVQTSGGVPAVITRNPLLDKALVEARAINARPHRDHPELDTKFVRQYLGTDPELAKKKKRELQNLLHEDRVRERGGTPAEIEECTDAFRRVMVCTKRASAPVELAKANPGFSSVIIVAAASIANRGLAMADEGLKAAQAAWERKVADGTVDAVKAQVRERASDLFDFGRSMAQRGWAEAIRRTPGGKS